MQEKLTYRKIYDIIKSIKQNAIEKHTKVFTNIYTLYNEIEQSEYAFCVQGANGIVFWKKDNWDVCRVFFVASDLLELSVLLSEVPSDVVMDYNTHKNNNMLNQFFIKAGFQLKASYVRKGMGIQGIGYEDVSAHSDILDDYYDESIVEYALYSDIDEIMQIIEDTFDKETDHLPARENLIEWIKNKWVLIYREEGKIYTIYIYEIFGKKMYSALSYNSVTADKMYTLEKKGYLDAVQKYDVQYIYAWFNRENFGAMKRNVLKEDGLINYIYKKQ